jgi:hypothetical protein
MIILPCREFGLFEGRAAAVQEFYLQYGLIVELDDPDDPEKSSDDVWASICWLTEDDAPGQGGPLWANNYMTVIV